MKILFVASEMTPYAKTGGLGDVIGYLPSALTKLGHEVTCCVPLYRCAREMIGAGTGFGREGDAPVKGAATRGNITDAPVKGAATGLRNVAAGFTPAHFGDSGIGVGNITDAPVKGAATGGAADAPVKGAAALSFRVAVGSRGLTAEIVEVNRSDGVRVLFVRRDEFFDRSELYHNGERDYEDNAERFIFFSKAVVELLGYERYRPDVVHCHDWQSALVPVEALYRRQTRGIGYGVKTVFTIHNLAYQGLFPATEFPLTGLPGEFFTPGALEFYGKLNLMKGGLVFSDAITTVSPTYAREIQTPAGGCGLEPVLRSRRDRVHGILNGVDYREWNPATDRRLNQTYGAADLAGKRVCRAALVRRFNLNGAETAPTPGPSGGGERNTETMPVAAFISRLTDQKGVDLLAECMDDLVQLGLVVVVLGKGERRHEERLLQRARRHPQRVVVEIGHDEQLSHEIQGGADLLLVPSKFEPCGLTQLYALKYGTIPVVHATGGLADTVTEVDTRAGTGHGFRFTEYSARAFVGAVGRAVAVYQQPKQWKRIMERAMACDFSWRAAAVQYEKLYEGL